MAQNTNYNPAAASGNTQLNFNVPMKDAKGKPWTVRAVSKSGRP